LKAALANREYTEIAEPVWEFGDRHGASCGRTGLVQGESALGLVDPQVDVRDLSLKLHLTAFGLDFELLLGRHSCGICLALCRDPGEGCGGLGGGTIVRALLSDEGFSLNGDRQLIRQLGFLNRSLLLGSARAALEACGVGDHL
jgi:hypothetical protein